MTKKIRIAIDGPGGAGKSTIAKLLASKLEIDYIDTGSMYRAIGYKMSKESCDVNEKMKIVEILDRTEIDFINGHIYLDGKDVEEKIRTVEAGNIASNYAKIPEVRAKLVCLQKAMGEKKSLVMDGRDIGTNVLPDAEFKFFITAKAEERARRRCEQLEQKGEVCSFEKVLDEIRKRDYQDTHRKLNPLVQAEDAILVDTTSMSIQEVVDFICNKMI